MTHSNDSHADGERRALVTGAAGFVGSTLCNYLRGTGWAVVQAVNADQHDGLVCDITNPGEIEKLLEDAGPVTHVFHLAAIAFVPAAAKHPARAMDVNLTGTIHLIEALRARGFAGRLLYIGSADAYGPPQSLPVTEDHPLRPVNPYAISKAAADAYCAYVSKTCAMEIVRMRPFNHSGAGQASELFLSSCARQAAEMEAGLLPPVMKIGNLEVRRDFTHVDDVVRAFELAALAGQPGEAYNVCSGTSVLLQDALQAILDLSRVDIAVEIDPERVRPVDVLEIRGSYDRLQQDTGWTPERPFDDVLRDLLDYWRGRVATAGSR